MHAKTNNSNVQMVVGKCKSCKNLWRLVVESGSTQVDCPQCHITIKVRPYLGEFVDDYEDLK